MADLPGGDRSIYELLQEQLERKDERIAMLEAMLAQAQEGALIPNAPQDVHQQDAAGRGAPTLAEPERPRIKLPPMQGDVSSIAQALLTRGSSAAPADRVATAERRRGTLTALAAVLVLAAAGALGTALHSIATERPAARLVLAGPAPPSAHPIQAASLNQPEQDSSSREPNAQSQPWRPAAYGKEAGPDVGARAASPVPPGKPKEVGTTVGARLGPKPAPAGPLILPPGAAARPAAAAGATAAPHAKVARLASLGPSIEPQQPAEGAHGQRSLAVPVTPRRSAAVELARAPASRLPAVHRSSLVDRRAESQLARAPAARRPASRHLW